MFELVPFGRRKNSLYDPFGFFDDFERSFTKRSELSHFRTDIMETGKNYELIADLPGFKKEDIKIDIERGLLTISAERRSENEDKEKKNGYVHIERSYGKYSRSFDVSGVNLDEISASYNDGVLRIVLPKLEEKTEAPRSVEIN